MTAMIMKTMEDDLNYFHVMTTDDDKKTFKSRHHCRLSNCEYWLSWTNTVRIRTKDPNNHSDTETGTLSSNITYQVLIGGIISDWYSFRISFSK